MIGGNFCSWYSGIDSYIVSQKAFPEKNVFVPSMGRKRDNEELVPNLTHIQYKDWKDWMITLNQFYVGIHLMKTHAAGTFALNCAALKIPCIGYAGLDTQEKLHPELTIDLGDIESAIKNAKKLNDPDFYQYISNNCYELYLKNFHESVWEIKWKEIMNCI